MDNIKRKDLEIYLHDSEGEKIEETGQRITIIYNDGIISEKEVEQLIKTDRYRFDDRIIIVTPQQADNLIQEQKT